MKKNIVRIGLGLILLLAFLGHAAKYYRLPLVDRLEAIVYDTRLALTMPRTVDPRIVILDIDEKSLVEKEKGGEGRWPWPRDRLATLLDKLFDHYKIAIVGFDIVFAERDESSGLKVLQQLAQKELKEVTGFQATLKQLQPQLAYDEIFAAHIANRPVVLGYAFTHFVGESGKKGVLPPPALPPGTFAGKNINFASYRAIRPISPNCKKRRRAPDSSALIRIPMAYCAGCRCSPNSTGRITSRFRWRSCA